MYYEYDEEDDDLQQMLEGRDVEERPPVSKPKKGKRKPEYDGHGEEEVIREDDDLEDFIENDEDEEEGNGKVEAGDEREDKGDYGDDEAVEVPVAKPKIKRIVRNPQPKLDSDRLKSEKGLDQLIQQHGHLVKKLKGKGHEAEDLDKIMFCLEHWGHRLFPKLNFDDFLEKCEVLGHKKPIGYTIKNMRMGMGIDIRSEFVDDDDDDKEHDKVMRGSEDEMDDQPKETAEEAFDRVFGGQSSSTNIEPEKPKEPVKLTEEQREMIARKRLEAIEKRMARMQREQETAREDTTPSQQQQEPQTTQETIQETSQEEDGHDSNLLSTQEMMAMF